MKARVLVLAVAVAAIAGCDQTGDEQPAANAGAAAKPHPSYCFYTDADTKWWSVSRDKSGNVLVKGKAHLDDSRYRGELAQPEIAGPQATLSLTMAENRSYASPDNWWDMSFTIPASASVESVAVMCGAKTVAALKLPR